MSSNTSASPTTRPAAVTDDWRYIALDIRGYCRLLGESDLPVLATGYYLRLADTFDQAAEALDTANAQLAATQAALAEAEEKKEMLRQRLAVARTTLDDVVTHYDTDVACYDVGPSFLNALADARIVLLNEQAYQDSTAPTPGAGEDGGR